MFKDRQCFRGKRLRLYLVDFQKTMGKKTAINSSGFCLLATSCHLLQVRAETDEVISSTSTYQVSPGCQARCWVLGTPLFTQRLFLVSAGAKRGEPARQHVVVASAEVV